MAERLTKETFEEKAFQKEMLSLIDFYSDSCIPCKRMSPVLAQLEEEFAGRLFVGKVNVAYETELTERFQVMSAPTLLFFKDGELLARYGGSVKKAELEDFIVNRL